MASRPPSPSPLAPPRVHVVAERAEAERAVALELAQVVRARADAGRGLVLGLATGGTMVGVYRELVGVARAERLTFEHVRTFNLDEFVGLGPADPGSFARFMRAHLFDPLGLPPERARVPDGLLAARDPEAAARAFADELRAAGGIDLQLLGIGRNGHVAFNEPGAARASRTRVVELCETTRTDAAATFGGLERVPRRALTMGVADVLSARALRVLAFGTEKAEAVERTLRGPIGPEVPASFVRQHADVDVWLDPAAAARLAAS